MFLKIKKSRRNKKNKNKYRNNRGGIEFDYNETPPFMPDNKDEKEEQEKEEEKDNAAPLFNKFDKPCEDNLEKDDLGPAIDNEAQSFNKYIDS